MPLPAVLLGGAERRTDERIEAVEQGVQWSPQSIRQISSYRLLVVRVRVRRSASGRVRGRPRPPLRMSLSLPRRRLFSQHQTQTKRALHQTKQLAYLVWVRERPWR